MRRLSILFILLIIILLTACGAGKNKEVLLKDNTIGMNNDKNIDQDVDKSDNDEVKTILKNESIEDFIKLLNIIVYEGDSNKFLNFLDEYGVYSLSYFDDDRDENRVVLVFKEDIREDLFLVSSQSGKAGINLSGGTFSDEVIDIHFNDSIISDNSLLNIDWKVKDEKIIQNQLLDILDGLRELILINNLNVPQIFKLSENIYAFSFSDINENEMEKFYGYWILFEDSGESYVIRAIVELQ